MKKIKIMLLKWQISRINKKLNFANIFNIKTFMMTLGAGLMMFNFNHILGIMHDITLDDNAATISSPASTINTSEQVSQNLVKGIEGSMTTLGNVGIFLGIIMIGGTALQLFNASMKSKEQLEDELNQKNTSLEALTAKKELINLEKNIDKKEASKKSLL